MTESETPVGQTTNTADTGAAESAPTAAEVGGQAPAEQAAVESPKPPASGVFWGTGRRKCAVARVRLVPGGGQILVNKRTVDDYFREPRERLAVREPLVATKTESAFDVFVNVGGGGHSGQADAIRLGLARALTTADSRYEPQLREKGYLTRDARAVERKKYGQRKARRRFQFSKR